MQKKQYQCLDKVYEFDGTINRDDKKPTLKKYNKSSQIYDSNHSFCKYNIKKVDNLSFKSKYSYLVNFFNDFNKFSSIKTQKEKTEKKQV